MNHLGSYPCSIYFSSIKESYSTIDARIKCSFCCLQFPIWQFSETLIIILKDNVRRGKSVEGQIFPWFIKRGQRELARSESDAFAYS